MRNMLLYVAAGVCISLFCEVPAQGEDVYWRIDPNVKSCSMDISPDLTQDQFHRYIRQLAFIASFKSAEPAQTLGKNHFSMNIDYSYTPINQHDPAWINTFVHPDAGCPLGNAIKLPLLRAEYGISDSVDVGLIYSEAPDANYGLLGAEVKYALVDGSETGAAVAARASIVRLLGVADYDFDMVSLDVLASKKWLITPYGGLRVSYARARETTDEVNLSDENIIDVQPFLGLEYAYRKFRLAVEYDIGEVSTLVLSLGARF